LKNKYYKELKAQSHFNKLIKIIYPILNKVHNVKKTKHYWEIILFHWLKGFLVYYQQNKEKKIQSKKIDYIFEIKDTKYFLDKLDTNDSLFHKQYNYIINNLSKEKYNFKYHNLKFFIKGSIIFFFKKALWIFFLIIFKSNFYSNFSLNKKMIYKIFFKTKFKLFTLLNISNYKLIKIKKKNELRDKFKKKLLNLDNNLSLEKKKIISLISIFLPTTYLENYKKILNKNKDIIRFNPSLIFVDGDHVKNDQMHIIISEWVEKGSLLYSIQHAANEIDFKIDSFNYFNFKYATKFISWGLGKDKKNNLPSFRLITSIERIKKFKTKKYDMIFFPRVERENNSYSYCHDLNLHKKYKISKKKLIEAIVKNKKIKLLIKEKSLIGKFDNKTNIKNVFYLDGIGTDFYNQGKVNVFNHFSNGFLECIYANIPAILYLPDKNSLTKEDNSLKEINKLFIKYGLIFVNQSQLIDVIKKKKIMIILKNIKKIKKDLIFKKNFLNPFKSINAWKQYIKNVRTN
jgi:putative transferase (TIGR04331 family)